jgi:hypothetical protein
MCECMSVSVCVHMYRHGYVCIYVRVCLCVRVCICVNTSGVPDQCSRLLVLIFCKGRDQTLGLTHTYGKLSTTNYRLSPSPVLWMKSLKSSRQAL